MPSGIGIKIRLDPRDITSRFRRMSARMKLAVETDFPNRTRAIAARAQQRLSDRTPGELGQGWDFSDRRRTAEGTQTFVVVHRDIGKERVRAALMSLEYGSKPHQIPLNEGSTILRFLGRDGSILFRKKVFHPGTKPMGFLRQTIAEANAELDALFRDMERKTAEIWRSL